MEEREVVGVVVFDVGGVVSRVLFDERVLEILGVW